MEKCSEDCLPICDFCTHFKDTVEDDVEHFGICKLSGKEIEWITDSCDNFKCIRCSTQKKID